MIINVKSANVRAAWAAASFADGAVGYNVAKTDEWKYFHQMNGIVGVVNGGVAVYSMLRTRKQLTSRFNPNSAIQYYKNDRDVLLVHLGLDLTCMVTGAYLAGHAKDNAQTRDMNLGYGKALLVQGIFLTALDNIILLSHNKYHDRWGRILDELRVSGAGLSYVHTF